MKKIVTKIESSDESTEIKLKTKRDFSSPNGEKTVIELFSALNCWNETIQKRAQKPIDLQKSTLQNSTYIDVLLHCNALKEQVILTVL